MGDAPDKPDPSGFIALSSKLSKKPLGVGNPPIAYIGDTVADIKTVINARKKIPQQKFISLAIAPPHLHKIPNQNRRFIYEDKLREAGADLIIDSMDKLKNEIVNLFTRQ
tara:strand:- start:388 stop:717 length:330 start_codon:yes stop_codon:yes gene_type:complete